MRRSRRLGLTQQPLAFDFNSERTPQDLPNVPRSNNDSSSPLIHITAPSPQIHPLPPRPPKPISFDHLDKLAPPPTQISFDYLPPPPFRDQDFCSARKESPATTLVEQTKSTAQILSPTRNIADQK